MKEPREPKGAGRPHVALLTHSFPPNLGGVETVTQALAHGLTTRHGASVTVITLDRNAAPTDGSEPYTVLRAPDARAVARVLQHADVAVFHAPILAFGLLAALARCPRINVVHGRMRDDHNALSAEQSASSWSERLQASVKVTLRKRFITSAALPVAVSRDVASECGITRVIHNGYDDAVFTIDRPVDERERSRIAFVGRLSPEKGADDAIEAVAALVSQGLHPSLDVIGEGPERPSLEARVRDLDLANSVRFHGRLAPAQVNRVLNECSTVVMPSRAREAFAMVGIEAQAAGCVVVASDAGGLPESLDGSGLLVPPADPAALAAALRRVFEDEDLRSSLQTAGRRNAAAHTVGHMVDAHHAAIMETTSKT